MPTTVEPQAQPAQKSEPSLQRQYVNFMFFKTDRAFRREPADVKAEAKRELAEIVNKYNGPMMVLPYTTVGLKPNTDFMLWRISYDLSLFTQMAADINKSILGKWLDIPVSYLSMTKHSQYVDEHVHEGQEGRRLRIVPGKRPYLFVYSFGLDDQDFVVAFEADQPAEFLDLVQDLRETESSKYTVRDTPMYTCKRATIEEIAESLA